MCGGTEHRVHHIPRQGGLSPRVRGNRGGRRGEVGIVGSIPACAGEPQRRPHRPLPVRVYPRVCGGTRHGIAAPGAAHGLSPRVRGNPVGQGDGVVQLGSIPACAGEPNFRGGRAAPPEVYPRVCGGTTWTPTSLLCMPGLSPRVRGNRGMMPGWAIALRSIPACAGEPPGHHKIRAGHRVYPRVCGGTRRRASGIRRHCGLSPRVRGNPAISAGDRVNLGSIPACAGEPGLIPATPTWCAVYPRVCGGTRRRRPQPRRRQGLSRVCGGTGGTSYCASWNSGLSPRVRGNPPPELPAAPPELPTVYPRVCGGTLSARRAAG